MIIMNRDESIKYFQKSKILKTYINFIILYHYVMH